MLIAPYVNIGLTFWQPRRNNKAAPLLKYLKAMSIRVFARMLGICLCLLATTAFAQKPGKISGKVTSKKDGQTLIGVTAVVLQNGTQVNGAVTDLDGLYLVEDLAPGTYSVRLTYLGFDTAMVNDVLVGQDSTTLANVVLSPQTAGTTIAEGKIVITSQRDRTSNAELQALQRSSVTVLDGVSAESIRRSPDRNTGDVLRRVSGASIQGGRYVVVRGLADRYNLATVNGVQLPSTEADRKSFAFDVFPAALLDNLTIVKTATPDLPGEFAGGIIQVKTRDIPDENMVNVSIGGGYNSQSTFKNYRYTEGNGKLAWLGIDDGSRDLPSGFPSRSDYQSLTGSQRDVKATYSNLLKNNWAFLEGSSAPINPNFNISLSHKWKLFGNDLGFLGAITYSRSFKLNIVERGDYNVFPTPTRVVRYIDQNFVRNTLAGAMINLSYKVGSNNKFSFKTFGNVLSDDQTIIRTGADSANLQSDIRNYASWLTSNQLITYQLNGEHYLPKSKIRIDYGASIGKNTRNVPDLRRITYSNSGYGDTTFRAFIPGGSGSPTAAGRFFSNLKETINTGLLNVLIPINKLNSVKVGGQVQTRVRDFNARVFGYNVVGTAPQYYFDSLPKLRPEQIFTQTNINKNGYLLDEITNYSDQYTGKSQTYAAYAMLDNNIDRLHIVYGARFEHFHQQLDGVLGTVSSGFKPVTYVDTTYNDLLPSFNAIYKVNENSNLRLSGSRTLSRPEFRELAPFAFYDFNLFSTVVGSPKLSRARIWNADIRYETFRKNGQSASISLFYKYFDNPIEQLVDAGSGALSRLYSYQNIKEANDYGIEGEFRLKFTKLNNLVTWKQWDNFSLYGNAAYIQSEISSKSTGGDTLFKKRPLQGQSPYLLNFALQYNASKSGLSFGLLFNRIGRRINQVGDETYRTIWEATRTLFDAQISKKFGKKQDLEVKLTGGDLFNQPNVFYQDQPGYKLNADGTKELDKNGNVKAYKPNGHYNKETETKDGITYMPDTVIQRFVYGLNVSLGVSYRFH